MHGDTPVPAWDTADPDIVRGLSLSIEAYMELFPCKCEARCVCDETD